MMDDPMHIFHRIPLITFSILLCSGCSFIFVRGPGKKVESVITTRSNGTEMVSQEPACTESVAMPVLDTAAAVIFTVAMISVAGGSGECTKTDSAGNKTPADRSLCAALFAPVVLGEGASAIYGYYMTNKCRDAKERARKAALDAPEP